MFRIAKKLGLLFLAGVVFSIGPSAFASSFKAEWKAALKAPPPANSIAGAWEGVWRSMGHGVSGPLRCVIKDLGHGKYQARFHAEYHWFHFNYDAKLVAEKTATGFNLKGDADLGWMGGIYHYNGDASSTQYTSRYKSKMEFGELELRRPGNV